MKIVKESLDIKQSAGLVIIQDNKILLAHPTGNKWFNSYSIPKGHVQSGESFLDAALRETQEEVGLIINPSDINEGPLLINYTNKGKTFKQVYYYVVNPTTKILKSDIVLQHEEVDWAWFIDKHEAEKKILWRLKEVLLQLK